MSPSPLALYVHASLLPQQVVADKARMNSVLLYQLSVQLDELALISLSLTCRTVLSSISQLREDEHLWYLRTRTLISPSCKIGSENVLLAHRVVKWSDIYKHLSRALTKENPFLHTIECASSTQILLDLGYDPTMDGDSALYEATDQGEVETVKVLLADGRVNWTQHDPIVDLLIESRETEVLLTLVPYLDYSDGRIIEQIIVEDLSTVLTAMLQQSMNIPRSLLEENALALAICNNSLECVKVLLEDGRCSLNTRFFGMLNWSPELVDLFSRDGRIEASRS